MIYFRLEFDYDNLGRRTSKRVYTWSSGVTYDATTAAESTNWSEVSIQNSVYDGWNHIAPE